jgi:hypothetical protein
MSVNVVGDGDLYYFKGGEWRAVGKFNPIDLAPLAWWDATDATTVTASGTPARVSEWRSRVGTAKATQTTSTAQPIYDSTIPAVHFDALATSNRRWLTTDLSAARSNISMFAVVQSTDLPTNAFGNIYAFIGGTAGVGLGQGWVIVGNDTTFIGQVRSAAGVTLATGASRNTNVNVHTLKGTAASFVSIQTNLQNVASTATAIDPSAVVSDWRFGLGPDTAVNFHLRGYIHEVIIYDKVLSAVETAKVQVYLLEKWGL